jgi:hypothetical protein
MYEQYLETITNYNGYLDKLMVAIQHFCEDLVASDYSEISMVMPSIVEGLDWVNEVVIQFVKVGILLADRQSDFWELLAKLTEALENKDYTLLHDLFSYEMVPLLGALKIDQTQN